jgi:YegS/Rv2252/BmrU family lipid kinase
MTQISGSAKEEGRALLIVNPIAGLQKVRAVDKLITLLGQGRWPLTVVETQKAGDAREAAAGAAAETSVIIAAGGDGTINEVICGMRGRDIPLGVVPFGTANLLAGEFGIPWDIEKACELIFRGRWRALDRGETASGCFLAVAGAGFDAAVVHRFAGLRKGNVTFASYLQPIIETMISYPFPQITVALDGERVTDGATAVIVANTRRYGGPFILTPDATPDDGLFDVCIFDSPNAGAYGAHMAAALLQSSAKLPGVWVFRAKTVECTSGGAVPVQLDGDPHGHLPTTFRIIAGAVKLIAP